MASDTRYINIQVACATEIKQKVISLQVPEGTGLAAAVALSGIADEFPELDMSTSSMGIYGRVESPHRILADQDRVEIYRPLLTNPRQARLNRAAVSKQNAATTAPSKEQSD
jgi:putative ubiquitin-RnfH superfamily antitoxin RatB of RatAB toxin-antitoxin module